MGDPDATLRIAVQYPTPLFATQLKEWLPMPFAFVEHDYRDPIFQPIVNGTADIVRRITHYTPFASLVKEASALDLVTKTCLAFRMSISMMASNPLANKSALSRNRPSRRIHHHQRCPQLRPHPLSLRAHVGRQSESALQPSAHQRHERPGLRHLRRWPPHLRAIGKSPLVRRPRRRGALRRTGRKALRHAHLTHVFS